MVWKQVKRFLPIIGIGIFVYLLIKLDIVNVLKEIENINLRFLAVAVVLVLIFFVTQTTKWFVIARKQKINISFWEAFRINLIANFYGFVTPSKLGSIIRVDYLKNKGDTGRGLSNFVVDKMLDLSSLFVLAIGVGFVFFWGIIPPLYLYLVVGIFILMIVLFLALCRKNANKSLLKFIYKFLVPKKMKEKSRELFDSFYQDMPSLKFFFYFPQPG